MGHSWREMDPVRADEHDRRMSRMSKLRDQLENVSLGEFMVSELEAVMRLFGLAQNSTGALMPWEEHLKLLEEKVEKMKDKG